MKNDEGRYGLLMKLLEFGLFNQGTFKFAGNGNGVGIDMADRRFKFFRFHPFISLAPGSFLSKFSLPYCCVLRIFHYSTTEQQTQKRSLGSTTTPLGTQRWASLLFPTSHSVQKVVYLLHLPSRSWVAVSVLRCQTENR